jgi:hypothetical protein
MSKGLYDKLYPNTNPGTELLNGKLLKSAFSTPYPCQVCRRLTVWFRQDIDARICSEQCAKTAVNRKLGCE